MKFNDLTIGNLKPKFPIIQGGMGIGISLHRLAGAVAEAGGIGVISGAQIGFREPNFKTHTLEANLHALKEELALARRKSPTGILGVNLMVAMKDYASYVKQAVASKVDVIISGAGLPLDLPSYTKHSTTQIIPIVSSAKAASLICKMWDKKHNYAPDAIIVEGPLAGGHLGFSLENLETPQDLCTLVNEVKPIALHYGEKYNKFIPVIAAGGIYTGEDVREALLYGADGVQMGTRFVTTYECDAPMAFKKAYIDASEETIGLIKSPVGMPGRGIHNDLILNSPGNTKCLYRCLHKCSVVDIPYCISDALIQSALGDVSNGLLFCGSSAYKASQIETVDMIFKEIHDALNREQ